MKKIERQIEEAIKYVRDNKSWDESEEQHAWNCIGRKMPIPYYIVDKIRDLIDEYTGDNDLQDDWWQGYIDEEEIFCNL